MQSMKQNLRIRNVMIFSILMSIIFIFYLFGKKLIIERKEYIVRKEIYDTVYTSSNELTQTINCSPLIDEYGIEKEYLLEFDLKTSKDGVVYVHILNDSTAKYSFMQVIEGTTEYNHYELRINPELVDDTMKTSYLVFYGEYNSGVCSTVQHLVFDIKE